MKIGAGERPNKLNGAFGVASPNPQRLRLLKPKLIRMIAAAAKTTPTRSIFTSGRPSSGLRRKLSNNTSAETPIRMPNAGRQPMKVPRTTPIKKANTPAPARAEPSAPSAVACCVTENHDGDAEHMQGAEPLREFGAQHDEAGNEHGIRHNSRGDGRRGHPETLDHAPER